MDATTARLVDFALRSEYGQLGTATIHECKRRLIDTFASAMGAYDEPLSGMARAIAKRHSGVPGASVWGSDLRTTPETAAFANGVMLRFLDISDTYLGKGGGHPSDVIAAVLAVGESIGADGASVINAITLAYDVYCSLNDAVEIGSKGWDQTLYAVLGSVVGAGRLLRLSREQMGHAVALALTPNLALRQTRHGDLSAWKGCAGANAARNAVFAATLAQDGFTGPSEVFEGRQGLWHVLGRFEWTLPEAPGAMHMVTQTHLKGLPICYHGQSAAWCALELRSRVGTRDIREINVETYRGAVEMTGGDPTRWAPASRETADHSMPYMMAIALLDGAITSRSFAPERFTDSAVVELMRKVKVSEDAALSAQFPEAAPGRVRIRLSTGEELTKEIRYPPGHVRNPMDDAAVEAKFRDLFHGRGDENQCRKILASVWNLEQASDIGRDVIKLLAPSASRDG